MAISIVWAIATYARFFLRCALIRIYGMVSYLLIFYCTSFCRSAAGQMVVPSMRGMKVLQEKGLHSQMVPTQGIT